MLRKLITLGLLGAGIAYVLRMREHGGAEQGSAPPTGVGDAVVPDTSAEDPLVRREENLAAAEASEVGGGQIAETCTPALPHLFKIGTTVVQCSATGKAGDSATGSFEVTVSLRHAKAH